MPHPLRLLLPFSACAALAAASVSSTGWLDQSWFFSWDPPNLPFPVPTTAQCDTLHVTWSRQAATGPDPVAPYILQIYSSNYVTPFIISTGSNIPETYFTVPFAAGSEYEVCMFDSKGNTGGCQAIYTVYPNTTTSSPTCANVTTPAKSLSVISEAQQGSLSPYGWVPSCSDIRVTPQNGKPPFTFTVAPALHPPLNITSNDMSPINWTVSLTWASPFFISLVDSQGLTWSNGPIHSGKGTTECIGGSRHASVGVTVGAAFAGAAIGASVSLLAAYLVSRRRKRYIIDDDGSDRPIPFYPTNSPTGGDGREDHQHSRSPTRPGGGDGAGSRYARLPSMTGALNEFHVEPFMPSRASAGGDGGDTASLSGGLSPSSASGPGRVDGGGGTGAGTGSQVYVIHHDMGRAPVSVVTAEGMEVVELPPGYSTSFDPNNQEQQRQQPDRQQQRSEAGTSTSGAAAAGSQSATTSSGGGRGGKSGKKGDR